MIDQLQDSYNQPVLYQNLELQPQKIKELLKSSFEKLSKISPSNSELSKAHQQISKTMKSELFFDTIISLLIQFQHFPQRSSFVKQILTTFTTYIRYQQCRNSLVKRIDPTDLNKKLIQLFLNQRILQNYRHMLLKCYPQFIYANGMETIRTQTIDSFCTVFGMLTMALAKQINKENFFHDKVFQDITLYISLAHCVIKGPIQQNLMKKILRAFLFPILSVTNRLISAIQMSVTSKNQALYIQISYWGQKYMDFFRAMVVAAAKDYMAIIRTELLQNPLLLSLLKTSLALSVQPKQLNQLIQVVVKSNGNNYLERINQIKKSTIDIINVLAKLTLSAQSTQKQSSKKQYEIPCEIMRFVLENVVPVFVKQFQLLEFPKNQLPHKAIYMTLIKAIAKIVKIFKFYNQSQKIRNYLIFNLCLPLLQRSQLRKITSAQDFKGQRQDILNMHAADIPQNAACALIQAYLDKVDGSVFHFSKQIVNMIYFHLSANPNYFQALPPQLTQTYFFNNIDYVNQIQCGLIVLALLSYEAPQRQDIILLVQTLLVQKKQFFFKPEHPGTFKSAVLLCYTYYIDNFYQNLVNKKSSTRQFHLRMLEDCCVFIKDYTGIKQKSVYSRQQLIMMQIAALQALDCLQNSITQSHFLAALFYVQGQKTEKVNEQIFINIFQFLIFQLKYELNVQVIDILIQFYTEAIKNQCQKGFALKRFHYEYENVPSIIRTQLSAFICPQIYKLHNMEYIPNKKLIHTKIMTLLSLIFTCCENPHQYINLQFFNLQTQQEDTWDRVEVLDIYLRRAIVLKKEGQSVHYSILQSILQFCKTLTKDILKTGDFKKLLGILINLMIVNEQIIDNMIEPIGTLLIQLLAQEQKTETYNQQLQDALQKCSYVLMIAIQLRMNQQNSRTWGALVQIIYNNFLQRSSHGFIVFTNSSEYIGKLLTICLVFIFNMRKANLDPNKIKFLWSNAIKVQEVYKSTTEKLIVSITIIKLLSQRETILESDLQCITCFKILSSMLHSISNKFLKKQTEQQESDKSDSFGESDQSQVDHKEDGLNYRQYTIACNQYTLQDSKEAYILAFKDLCHKLKQFSSEFLKLCLQSLALPISNFVKQKVFYFEGNFTEKGLRKVIKVKK